MKNKAPLSSRSRSEILGAIASIPRAVQGKICEMHKTLAGEKPPHITISNTGRKAETILFTYLAKSWMNSGRRWKEE